MHRTTTSRRILAGVAATAAVSALGVVLAAPAQAIEDVSSSINLGCTIWNDDDHYESSDEPEGVGYDGERLAASAVPAGHALSVANHAEYEPVSSPRGEDCGAGGGYADRLSVLPGTSGLTAGTPVRATVRMVVDTTIDEQLDPDSTFITHVDIDLDATLSSEDDCVDTGEGYDCRRPFAYRAEHRHEYYGDDSWFYRTGERSEELQVDDVPGDEEDGTVVFDEHVDEYAEYCSGLPCDHEPAPESMDRIVEQQVTLVVGHRYDLSASAGIFTQVYDSDTATAAGRIDAFTVDVTTASGAELVWASAGTPADTTPPELTVPADIEVTSTDGNPVPVTFEATSSDPTAVVGCDPASGSSFAVGATTVTCTATDPAGNITVDDFTVTVTHTPPVDPFAELDDLVAGVDHDGVRHALQVKLDEARAAFEGHDQAAGCEGLAALANQVRALSGKKIATADADAMLGHVEELATAYGC